MTKTPVLSIVIPVYNEAKIVDQLSSSLNKIIPELPKETEIIFVDDGSKDDTYQQLKALPLKVTKRIIKLSRNFGQQSALLAGLDKSKGEYVVTLDADLQHPLELIPKMIEQHQKGIDVVLTQRIDTSEVGIAKKQTSKFFYNFFNSIGDQKINPSSSDFRSMNRTALQALLSLPERRKFLRAMVQWIGFTTVTIPFTVKKRIGGESKYSWGKMISLAIEGITSFSTAPLYLSAFVGLVLFVLAVVYALYVLYARLFFGHVVQGWASVLFVQLIIGGFICLFLGILGLYVAAVYDEVKNRPHYIIAEEV